METIEGSDSEEEKRTSASRSHDILLGAAGKLAGRAERAEASLAIPEGVQRPSSFPTSRFTPPALCALPIS
jgi:hypothetical protein